MSITYITPTGKHTQRVALKNASTLIASLSKSAIILKVK